jgi:hypothetical protein
MQKIIHELGGNGNTAIILETILKMSYKDQLAMYHELSLLLGNKPQKTSTSKKTSIPIDDFFDSAFGKYILQEADRNIPIEKVRQVLSNIAGSFAQEIIAEREER